ncbi:Vegetative incompatibility protein [Wickerhamomyces ciferrii]|uniref:Vegetative incompatibility protein n=1 Tax=Wickerhamomyces ciferrii (strain ATCC 14091 / BCRC 22168 / CBS 111 / JCM 3599 / NBRC 0793 / NRRL Y-1031 F-60-10) TaxID=1206466 RepID=K0KEW6_WICCF|nr:Vegetative incompatibility protein [Wickerhamomyces ciferrii]CCH41491.1 Vegetative incompatibility protein [Wickerhamomyces ciferrii]
MSQQQEQEQGQDEFIAVNEVDEVYEGANEPEPISDDEDVEEIQPEQDQDQDEQIEGGEDRIEIDMSNNSWGYFDKHEDSVFTVIAHPTLPLVASGGGDNTVYLWTSHSQPPKFAQQIKGHNESIITGGFTGDGEFLITGDMAGKILIHQSTKKGQVWKLFGELEETEEIVWISVHPKQPVFAFGGADGSVWVYQITPSVEQIMSGFAHQQESTGGVFVNVDDLDALHLVTISTDGSIVGWNAFTGSAEFKLSETAFKGQTIPWISIKLQPNSNILAIGSNEGTLAIVNITNGSVLTTFRVVELKEDQEELDASIETISWSTELPLIALGLVSGAIILFDTKTWKERHSKLLEDAVTKLEFVPGTPYLVGSSMDSRIYKWDSRTGEEVFKGVGHNMGVLDFSVIENGNKLITAGDEGVSLLFVTNEEIL